jgi:cell division protein DivIC
VSKRLPRISAAQIVIGVTALVVGYLLVGFVLNVVHDEQLDQQEAQLSADIEHLEARYERLQALKEYITSDEYIEAVAREELGLVREGETGFVVISSQPEPTPAPGSEDGGLWWDVLIR